MIADLDGSAEPGVYMLKSSGKAILVHRYQLGEYGLEKIPECLQVGRLDMVV